MPFLWRSIAVIGIAQVASVGFNLLTLIITARTLGPAGRGLLSASIAWAMVFATVAGLSLGPALTYRMQYGGKAVALAVHAGTLACVALGLGILAGLAFLAAGHYEVLHSLALLPGTLLVLAGLWIPLGLWEPYAAACFARANRIELYARLLLTARMVASFVLIAIAVSGHLTVPTAMVAVLAGQLALALFTIVRLHGIAGALRPRVTECGRMLRPALKLHATTVAALVIEAATLLMIFRLLSAADAGTYQLAQQVATLLLIAPQAVGAVLHARLAQSSADEDWPLHRRLLLQVLGLVALAAFMTALLAPVLVRLIGGPSFGPAADLLVWLLPAMAGPAMALVLAPQWIGRGLFGLNGVLTVGTALLLLALTYWGIVQFGTQGAVWARVAILGGVVGAVQFSFALWVELRWRRQGAGRVASTIRSP